MRKAARSPVAVGIVTVFAMVMSNCLNGIARCNDVVHQASWRPCPFALRIDLPVSR